MRGTYGTPTGGTRTQYVPYAGRWYASPLPVRTYGGSGVHDVLGVLISLLRGNHSCDLARCRQPRDDFDLISTQYLHIIENVPIDANAITYILIIIIE